MEKSKIILLRTLVNASTANKLTITGRLADITPFSEDSAEVKELCGSLRKAIVERHGFFNKNE